MTSHQYERSIAIDGAIEIEIRKSRFICTLARVNTEGEARSRIETLRKTYWGANHHCTAWRIGPDGRRQRSSDDGEPSGTAGAPMLEVLKRRDVTDLVAIVTRYFGGTRLGAGGLIRAYGAVVTVVDQVGIVERRPLHVVSVAVSHTEPGRIEHALRSAGYIIRDVAYNAGSVMVTLRLEPGHLQAFENMMAEETAGRAVVLESGIVFTEVKIR